MKISKVLCAVLMGAGFSVAALGFEYDTDMIGWYNKYEKITGSDEYSDKVFDQKHLSAIYNTAVSIINTFGGTNNINLNSKLYTDDSSGTPTVWTFLGVQAENIIYLANTPGYEHLKGLVDPAVKAAREIYKDLPESISDIQDALTTGENIASDYNGELKKYVDQHAIKVINFSNNTSANDNKNKQNTENNNNDMPKTNDKPSTGSQEKDQPNIDMPKQNSNKLSVQSTLNLIDHLHAYNELLQHRGIRGISAAHLLGNVQEAYDTVKIARITNIAKILNQTISDLDLTADLNFADIAAPGSGSATLGAKSIKQFLIDEAVSLKAISLSPNLSNIQYISGIASKLYGEHYNQILNSANASDDEKNQAQKALIELNSVKGIHTLYDGRLNKVIHYGNAIAIMMDNNEKSIQAGFPAIFVSKSLRAYIDENKYATINLASQAISRVGEKAKKVTRLSHNEIFRFVNTVTLSSRLAKLANPYNENLALAYAINNIKDEKFASNSDRALSDVVRSYTDRFNHDNDLWANIIGVKAKVDNFNPSLYGFSVGYDKAFDNTILGGYISYAKGKLKANEMEEKSHNIELGIYSRAYIDNSEIDLKASYGYSKNKIDTYQILSGMFLSQNGRYSSRKFSTDVTYGYLFELNDKMFLKPFLGLEYNHVKTNAYDEKVYCL